MKKIGFIGLGIMGSRMAANLLKGGYDVVVYNRTRDKAEALLEKGATHGLSPKELSKDCDVFITMLSTPEVVETLANGAHGFLDDAKKDAIWINCSTIDPASAKRFNQMAEEKNTRYLDAPVAGTKGPAENGELLFLVGGDEATIEAVRPLFEIMGKKIVHLGEAGKGSAMKVLINQMLAHSVAGFFETLTMGKAMGFDEKMLFTILTATPVIAPVIKAIQPRIESKSDEVNFPLKWIQKDLHLSSSTAYENNVATPLLNATKELFAQAKQHGYGNYDFTAIYHFMEKR